MTKYLVCILVSSNIDLVKVSLESIVQQKGYDDYEIFLIINTLDESFYKEVMDTYMHHSIDKLKKIIRTESNGKPGKGHNSVLRVFAHHLRYEYLIMVDGDDYLYPYAIQRINNVYSKCNSDMIALVGGSALACNRKDFIYSLNDDITLQYAYKLHVCREPIKRIGKGYNNTIATPFRLLSSNRKVLDIYKTLYHENMYMYDDYYMFLILYKEIFDHNRLNVLLLHDSYIYLYNNCNTLSVHFNKGKTEDTTYIKEHMYKEFNIPQLKCEELTIKSYASICPNEKNHMGEVGLFYKNIIDQISKTIETTEPTSIKQKIMFIDTGDWTYHTNQIKPMGGTESAIFCLSEELANVYNICVLTNHKENYKISDNLLYNTISIKNISSFQPDYIIWQGKYDHTVIKQLDTRIRHIVWIHHDINVHWVNNFYNCSQNTERIHAYIFVSHWQKNRYIQHFKLPHKQCHVMQNAISNTIYKTMNMLPIKKTKTLIYISSPYRGLLLAYHFFKKIQQSIPDIRFKIFSSFDRDLNANYKKTTFEPLTTLNITNDYDRFYSSLYMLCIQDPAIDYYGSVPQPVLHKHLKEAMILFYPNTYPETCCTSILEAMAYRCNVITSELGALPETSNGFSSLFNPTINVTDISHGPEKMMMNPIQPTQVSDTYTENFIHKTVELVKEYESKNNQLLLDHQVDYITEKCIWKKKVEICETIFTP